MKVCDIIQLMQPWDRLKISGENKFGANKERIWTDALTEAQKYAYWNHEVVCHYIEQSDMTVYCIVKEGREICYED